jgi:hypothetical protein
MSASFFGMFAHAGAVSALEDFGLAPAEYAGSSGRDSVVCVESNMDTRSGGARVRFACLGERAHTHCIVLTTLLNGRAILPWM